MFLSLPLHLFALPRGGERGASGSDSRDSAAALQPGESAVFVVLAAVLTIGAVVLSTVGTHLLALLQARGLELVVAVGLGALVGPSQVGARVVEMLASRHYHPVWTMITSTVLMAIGATMLFLNTPVIALALILYGAGNGIGSIARGTLPLALFGPQRYPVLMGRLALPLLIAMAVSPYLGGLVFARGGADWTFGLLMVLALANVLLVFVLRLLIVRKA
jgi:hypothetical protein